MTAAHDGASGAAGAIAAVAVAGAADEDHEFGCRRHHRGWRPSCRRCRQSPHSRTSQHLAGLLAFALRHAQCKLGHPSKNANLAWWQVMDADDQLLESLADAEHAGWARWMKYLLEQCAVNQD